MHNGNRCVTRGRDTVQPSLVLLELLLILILSHISGCATTPPENPPLTRIDQDAGYNFQNVVGGSDKSSDVLLMLAFSGGGTQAAAFSYGVLKELSETRVGREGQTHPLSDEVDVITSVSGGSFTAAYFGLFGDRIFRDYEHDCLRRDVQGELTGQALNPFNWPRLLSPY